MLLPYLASDKRRSMFWALLWIAVSALAVFALSCFIRSSDTPISPFWILGSSVLAVTLLCVWGAMYIQEEPGLVRIVLIGGAVFFLLLTVAIFWAAIAPPSIQDTKEMRVKYDIQSIRTVLLSYRGTTRHYPSTNQGLNALVPRLMEELPKDPWGAPYVYRYPGRKDPNGYDLFSAGPDRLPDTADDDWGE